MRALQALAVVAAVALTAALPARAGEIPLAGDSLIAALRGDQVWCSGWRDRDRSCEDVAYVDSVDGAEIRQITRYRVSLDPDLQMAVRQTMTMQGGALCATFKFADLDIVVLVDGEPAPAEQALPILVVLSQSLADLEGKRACETFVRDEATGEIRSTATLDGEPAPEFDSVYRLIPPDTRIKLRPMFEDTEEPSPV